MRPSSAHRRTSSRVSVQSFCSSRSSCGSTSPVTKSVTVCATMRCSSVRRSGVKTASAATAVKSHSPPFRIAVVGGAAVGISVVSQQILDRVSDFADLAVEQMVGAVDDDELFGVGGPGVELPHLLQRAELVALSM